MKLSTFLAAIFWSSFVGLFWALLLKLIETNGLSYIGLCVFAIFGFVASLAQLEAPKKP